MITTSTSINIITTNNNTTTIITITITTTATAITMILLLLTSGEFQLLWPEVPRRKVVRKNPARQGMTGVMAGQGMTGEASEKLLKL
jgi:hypothetical protein